MLPSGISCRLRVFANRPHTMLEMSKADQPRSPRISRWANLSASFPEILIRHGRRLQSRKAKASSEADEQHQ